MTTPEEQFKTFRALAAQHFPYDKLKQQDYLIAMLERRVREYEAMRLPVREMREE